jgi:electron transfer flavoprotein alpha subunit
MGDVLVMAEHLDGALTEITFEMLAQGKSLAGQLGGKLTALLVGGTDGMAAQLGAAERVYVVPGDANFHPQAHGAALRAAVQAHSPQLVMIGSTATGMDLAGPLASALNLPLAAYCTALAWENGSLRATAQLFGGKLEAITDLGAGPCVVMAMSGIASAEEGRQAGKPALEPLAAPATDGKVTFKRLIQPEQADVDITAKDVLVAIGRGIGKKEDIEVAQELADKLGAALAASRPIIDAGWLPKSRQVGKSGLKVKPKVYLALGISGAPEHIEGMKGAGTIIAVNSDQHAPIFAVAHYGMVADLFDVCEELMELL